MNIPEYLKRFFIFLYNNLFFEKGIFEIFSIPKINIVRVKAVEVHKHLRIWGESCRHDTPVGAPRVSRMAQFGL
jgi:hypothetical protein